MRPPHSDPILQALVADEEDEATYHLLAAMHDEDDGRWFRSASGSAGALVNRIADS